MTQAPTAESIRDDLLDDLLTYETTIKERSQQIETGASQLYGCIAEGIFRLRGTPAEPRLSWQAWVGTAMHEALATIRPKVRDGVICEQRFVYKNVPASVDLLVPDKAYLADYKTQGEAEDIADLLTDGPSPKWMGQLMVGAAGAREAGYTVDWVAIILLPREGATDDIAVMGPWPFDQKLADEAAAWSADVDALAADETVDPREHRGKPAFWCYSYCGFASLCRGERPAEPDLDELAQVVEPYREAQDARDAAAARMKALRALIPVGMKGIAGRAQFSHSAGYVKPETVEDVEALREFWRFINGDDEPLPTTVREKPVSPVLRVTWAKTKGDK